MITVTQTKRYINQIKGNFETYCDDQPGTCSILRSYTRVYKLTGVAKNMTVDSSMSLSFRKKHLEVLFDF